MAALRRDLAVLRHELAESARVAFYVLALRVAPGWTVRRLAGGALTRHEHPDA